MANSEKRALDQLGDVQRACVAGLVGAEDCPAFRNHLRDMPALPEGFSLGEMAIAYMQSRILYLKRVNAVSEPTEARKTVDMMYERGETPSYMRATLTSMAVAFAGGQKASFWKMKDGSVVCENQDGVFDERPENRYPA